MRLKQMSPTEKMKEKAPPPLRAISKVHGALWDILREVRAPWAGGLQGGVGDADAAEIPP